MNKCTCCNKFFENKSSLELHLIIDHKISLQKTVCASRERSPKHRQTNDRKRSNVNKPNERRKYKIIEKIKNLFTSESKKLDRDSPPIPNIKLQYCDLECRRNYEPEVLSGTSEKEYYELIEQQPKMKIKVI